MDRNCGNQSIQAVAVTRIHKEPSERGSQQRQATMHIVNDET